MLDREPPTSQQHYLAFIWSHLRKARRLAAWTPSRPRLSRCDAADYARRCRVPESTSGLRASRDDSRMVFGQLTAFYYRSISTQPTRGAKNEAADQAQLRRLATSLCASFFCV